MLDPLSTAANVAVTRVEDYEALIGPEAVDRILDKARQLADLHVVNINSTYYGGGVAQILSSITLLMNAAGIPTGWRANSGPARIFQRHQENSQCLARRRHQSDRSQDANL